MLIPNIGGFQILKEIGWEKETIADWQMNIFNSHALELLESWGVTLATLSPELTLTQIEKLAVAPFPKEVTVFGAMELMVSEYCALGAVLGGCSSSVNCSRPCMQKGKQYGLKDKAGFTFPIAVDETCRMHIFNSRDLCVLKEIPMMAVAGVSVFRLDLRRYTIADSVKIIKIYREILDKLKSGKDIDEESALVRLQSINKNGFTKGHFYRGV